MHQISNAPLFGFFKHSNFNGLNVIHFTQINLSNLYSNQIEQTQIELSKMSTQKSASASCKEMQHSQISLLLRSGLSCPQIQTLLKDAYGDKAFPLRTVQHWARLIKNGRIEMFNILPPQNRMQRQETGQSSGRGPGTRPQTDH